MKLLLSLMLLFASSAYAQTEGKDTSLTSSFQVPVEEEPVNYTNYIFGRVKQERIAFIIDTSNSFKQFQWRVLSSMVRTINELREDQQFTIVFLSRRNVYFNNAQIVTATAENKEAAIRFLNDYPRLNGYEPIRQAIEKIRDVNGKIDRIYFFGDGDCNAEASGFQNVMATAGTILTHQPMISVLTRRSKEFKHLKEVVQNYGVPMTSRSGYQDSLYIFEEDTRENLAMLRELTELSKGELINLQL